jgi:hypothetical protein
MYCLSVFSGGNGGIWGKCTTAIFSVTASTVTTGFTWPNAVLCIKLFSAFGAASHMLMLPERLKNLPV